ncbi:MAG: ABC transporter ATP-binding protein [Thaumarchaeota archaeon]|nr:ABC transporter ATP-binding protein [Nitrososphaerota archaeon]
MALLTIANLSKTYRTAKGGEVEALRNVSIDVDEGQLVSLVGPSGCGKSTLLKILVGVLSKTSGTISLSGQGVSGPTGNMGIVFQTPVLMKWRSVLSNVLLPIEIMGLDGQKYAERAHSLLEMVNLSGFESHYPWELSGGMQQRVSICRALIADPPILLMDEPFGALDALTREEMNLELLRIWNETKKTILFVTHSIQEAVFLSDKVVVMTPRPGKVDQVYDIDMPRPRATMVRYSPKFADYCESVRKTIYGTKAQGSTGTGLAGTE